jgi:hypothetical protein
MPGGHRALGEYLYTFSANGGVPTSHACTIDAHGEQTLTSRTFRLRPGTTVRFYVEQGAPLAELQGRANIGLPTEYRYTNAVEAVARGVAIEVYADTVVGGGECPNYSLSKLQKSTTGTALGKELSNFIGDRFEHGYTDLERFIDANAGTSDIITIRNRFKKSSITLQELIAALPAHYTEVRCCFCRTAQAPWQTSRPARQITGAARPNGGVY